MEPILLHQGQVNIYNSMMYILNVFKFKGFAFPANSFIFVVYVGDSNGKYIENTPLKTYFTL